VLFVLTPALPCCSRNAVSFVTEIQTLLNSPCAPRIQPMRLRIAKPFDDPDKDETNGAERRGRRRAHRPLILPV
jgi:hypothetical protein